MIKTLILKNFQAHSHLELNFQMGINIIHGETDSGKSSIVRALRWICFDDFSSNEARKLGTKETVVTVIFDSGIEISRIKSNSVNAYTLKNGNEEKRFDAIGKGIPEEISKVFGMELLDVDGVKINLNIAEQLAAPFLLGKEFPSTFRAKLFNQLTGNDIQDKIFKGLNKDILGFGRDISSLEKQTIDHQKELEVLEPQQVKVDKTYDNLSNSLCFIEDLNTNKESYLSLSKRLIENKTLVLEANNAVNRIKTLKENVLNNIKEKLSLLNALKPLQDRATRLQGDLADTEVNIGRLVVPSLDSVKVRGKIETLLKLTELSEDLERNSFYYQHHKEEINKIPQIDLTLDEKYVILDRLEKLRISLACLQDNMVHQVKISKNLVILNMQIQKDELQFNELKKSLPICPTCNQLLEKCNETSN